MSDDINNRIDELLVLAALGELSEADTAELDAALAADAAIADELAADLSVAAQLQSTTRISPPAAVKQSVMDAIAVVAQDAAPATTIAAPAPSAPEVISIDRARSRRWQPLAAAAAVAMLLVGGVIVGSRGSDQSQFDVVAEASDAQTRTLDGELGGTLDVVWSPSADAFVLAGTDIPVLTDAETYQLWLVDASGATPVGLFRPTDDGQVEQVFAGVDPTEFIVGVTIEPAGGSEKPTMPIVAAA